MCEFFALFFLKKPRFFSYSYIYWTDWGRTPKIERARLDGTERKVFISNGIQFPNGLAIDESEKKLYWAGTDAYKYGIIESVSFDGLNRSVIFYRHGYHPFALDIYQHFVFWTDWNKNAVLRRNKSQRGGEEEMIVISGLIKPMGLKILHRREEWRGTKIRVGNIVMLLFISFLSGPVRGFRDKG